MNVSFEIDIHDIMAFQQYALSANRQVRKMVRMIRFGFPAVFLFLGAVQSINAGPSALTAAWIFIILVSGLWIWLAPVLYERSVMRKLRKQMLMPSNASFFGRRNMTFDEEGIAIDTGTTTERTKWSGIVRAERTEDYFFIFLSDITAYVIPRRKISEYETETIDKLLSSQKL